MGGAAGRGDCLHVDGHAFGGARLSLLGRWRLTVGGKEVPLLAREQRLTALLGLWPERRPRLFLAATLWPTCTDERALGSLRVAVRNIKLALPGMIDSTRSTVMLHPEVEVDARQVHEVLESSSPAAVAGDPSLLRVLDFDELLPGWYDDWLLFHREQLNLRRLRLLQAAAQTAFEAEDWATALAAASLARRVEPLLDAANEIIVRSLIRLGDRVGAVRALSDYRERLWADLGIEPSPGLEQMVARQAGGVRRQ